MDGRSDDKGLEVESLTIASVCDKHYLFVGAERTSTIFVFDITVKRPHARIVRTCQRARAHPRTNTLGSRITLLEGIQITLASTGSQEPEAGVAHQRGR